MTDKKLTPRVGDRVLVKSGGHTRVGNVIGLSSGGGKYATVNVDGWGVSGGFLTAEVTVVDRDPVEWPEGWSDYDEGYVLHEPSNCDFDQDGLRQVLATGPDMLARWDELVRGGE